MTVPIADLKRILFSAMLMPVLAVPLLLFFFPIMPRTQLPLWNFLNPAATRTSGFSESVEPGSQSSIATSHMLAFRAEMPRLMQNQLYWRGTVFNRTNGNKWTREKKVPSEQAEFIGQKTRQVIYPEPSGGLTLIALDRPAALTLQRVSRSPDGVFELLRSGGGRLRYVADSQINGLIVQRNEINRQFYTQLPERLPARVKALASKIAHGGADDRARINFLENYFRNGNYRYSTVGLATGDRAIEQFIFDNKQGHCEFFASSFALLLRAAGVPCRLVGGYLGGEYNDLGGYYFVTDANAHVWVEAYIDGSGWTRIDPSSFATNSGDVWAESTSRTLKLRLSLVMDSLNYLWNRSVISYDFEQQVSIVRQVGSRLQGLSPSTVFRRSVPYLAGIMLLTVLMFALRHMPLFRTREQRILSRFLRMVEREFDISTMDGGRGLFEIAALADNSQVSNFVAIYAEAVYHDRRLTSGEYRQLQIILQSLKYSGSKIT